MKNVNIAQLKNSLSAYLELVEKGEEILVFNRGTIVAQIIPTRRSGADEEEELARAGVLRLPPKELSAAFLKRFLSERLPVVSKGSSVEAIRKDRDEA